MSRAFVLSLFVPFVAVVACSGGSLPVADDGTSSGPSGCSGSAPSCFGNDLSSCCGQDPAGSATCDGKEWKCGSAGAPGCNGMSCIQPADAGSSGCVGSAPNCFGLDLTMCCGQDPAGPAKCEGGKWMCGTAAAPGCNGTSCLGAGDGGSPGCSPSCDSNTAGAKQVCVSQQTVGGGQPFPDDAGNCPPGTVHAGDRCAPPPTYACAAYPTACGATLDCACASSVCTGNFTCLNTIPGQVNCQFGAP